MGAGESKGKESEILSVFTPEERQNLHKLYLHIVGNQNVLTEPFLKVKFTDFAIFNVLKFY